MQAAIDVGHRWAFSDVGAGAVYVDFYDNLDDLHLLNWPTIKSNSWGGKVPQKTAEFLVADRFPWSHILQIGCFDSVVATEVAKLLAGMPNAPTVGVRKDWYFQ